MTKHKHKHDDRGDRAPRPAAPVDLAKEITGERIAAMVEQAGPELGRHAALDFSGINFAMLGDAFSRGRIASYLPSHRGKVPALPPANAKGEMEFDLGYATISIPQAYAPYVRYVHEVFGSPSEDQEVDVGQVLAYFNTLRQWVGTIPGTLRDQVAAFLADAGDHHALLSRRVQGHGKEMAGDPNFEVVAHVPYMFAYLCRIMVDPRVPPEPKVDAAMGIVYFASPVDVIPEAFVDHPIALADDACVALWVIRALESSIVSKAAIESNWPGEAPLPVSVDVWEKPIRELLGEDAVDAVYSYFAMKRGRASVIR